MESQIFQDCKICNSSLYCQSTNTQRIALKPDILSQLILCPVSFISRSKITSYMFGKQIWNPIDLRWYRLTGLKFMHQKQKGLIELKLLISMPNNFIPKIYFKALDSIFAKCLMSYQRGLNWMEFTNDTNTNIWSWWRQSDPWSAGSTHSGWYSAPMSTLLFYSHTPLIFNNNLVSAPNELNSFDSTILQGK